MPIAIYDYKDEHVEAVRQFNARLEAGGATACFPRAPIPQWLPKIASRRLFQEHYLAVDEAGAVRGGYILKHQDFWIKDRVISIADFHQPISEGAVNKNYPHIGVHLLRDALGRQPLLFGLGMGGFHEPIAQFFEAAGWRLFSVPFLFRVVHPGVFLRNVTYLRSRRTVRCALDLLALSGVGWLGIKAVQACCSHGRRPDTDVTMESVDEFSDWADELWEQCKHSYGMSAVRDAATLRILYPKEDARFIRLKIVERSRPIGWAVLLSTQLSAHNQFGNMRLGAIVDCCALPADAAKVMRAARTVLEERGVDLIVSNQSHGAWCAALEAAGFLRGPTNFIFATSPALTRLLGTSGVADGAIHLNRGDGDGPINL